MQDQKSSSRMGRVGPGGLALLAALVLAAAEARATAIDYISTQVGVDTFVKLRNMVTMEAKEDDPAVEFGRISESQSASDTLIETSSTGVQLAIGGAISNSIIIPVPRRLRWSNQVTVSGHVDPGLEGEVFSRAFGEIVVVLEASADTPPNAILGLHMSLDLQLDDEDFVGEGLFIETLLVVENVTTGQVLFDSEVRGLPEFTTLVGLGIGDEIRLRYDTQIGGPLAEFPIHGRVEVDGTIDPVVVPEPGVAQLLLAGLAATRLARRRLDVAG